MPALQTLCLLGPAASSAPGANIQVAFVPAQAAQAVGVQTVEPGGSEAMFVDTQHCALTKHSKLQRNNTAWLRPGLHRLETLLNEACHIDTTIRLRSRLLLTCANWSFAAAQDTSAPATPAGAPAEEFNLLDHDDTPTGHTNEAGRTRGQPHQDHSPIVSEQLACQVRLSADDWSAMLLCDNCFNGYHTYCVDPEEVPTRNWFCPECASNQRAQPENKAAQQEQPASSIVQETEEDVAAGAAPAAAAAAAATDDDNTGDATGEDYSQPATATQHNPATAAAAATTEDPQEQSEDLENADDPETTIGIWQLPRHLGGQGNAVLRELWCLQPIGSSTGPHPTQQGAQAEGKII